MLSRLDEFEDQIKALQQEVKDMHAELEYLRRLPCSNCKQPVVKAPICAVCALKKKKAPSRI
jgi:hypothetical protein